MKKKGQLSSEILSFLKINISEEARDLLSLILEGQSSKKRKDLLRILAKKIRKKETGPVLTKQTLLEILISSNMMDATPQKETPQSRSSLKSKGKGQTPPEEKPMKGLSQFLGKRRTTKEGTKRKKEKEKDENKTPKKTKQQNSSLQDPIIEVDTGTLKTAPAKKPPSPDPSPSSTLTSQKANSKSFPSNFKGLKTIDQLRSVDLEKDFFRFFKSRYEKLEAILKRKKLSNLMNVKEAINRGGNNKRSIIIMINGKRTVKNGKGGLIRGEDKSGEIKLYVPLHPPLDKKFNDLLKDSVIACKFHKSSSGLPIVDEIFFPDIPSLREKNRSTHPHKVLFLSDLHIGSKDFLKGVFDTFIEFIQGKVDGKKEAEEIDSIIITGDIIDGVGVYPDQKNELKVSQIQKQYEIVRDYLKKIPNDKQIIIIPGNHDAAGRLLPQPSSPLFRGIKDLPNVSLLSNPAFIEIEGVKILLFHGQGFEEIAGSLGYGVNSPTKITTQVLKQRHLCPIWESVSNFPTEEDQLVIEKIPDILATGHLHVYGYKKYKSTLILNSSAFQGRTSWQRELGIEPTPGLFPVVNLKNFEVKFLDFKE